jgi:hypothetical protein
MSDYNSAWCEKRFEKWAEVAALMLGWKDYRLNPWEQYAACDTPRGLQIIHIGHHTTKSIRKQILRYMSDRPGGDRP